MSRVNVVTATRRLNYWIVASTSKKHFCSVARLFDSSGEVRKEVKALCTNSFKPTAVVGRLCEAETRIIHLDKPQETRFCHDCKVAFRKRLGVNFLNAIITTLLPEMYPGQPEEVRCVIEVYEGEGRESYIDMKSVMPIDIAPKGIYPSISTPLNVLELERLDRLNANAARLFRTDNSD